MPAELLWLWGVAYIGGLFIAVVMSPATFPSYVYLGLLIIALVASVGRLIIRPRWRMGPTRSGWLGLACVMGLAIIYFGWRLPTPAQNDISQAFSAERSTRTIVSGIIRSEPRLTRRDRKRFVLDAQQLQLTTTSQKPVAGKVYVTLPVSETPQLYPGSTVSIRGRLYQPSGVSNPGSFDFAKYLGRQGIFTGLKGQSLERVDNSRPPFLWSWRQRVLRAHSQSLDPEQSSLLSSMVLGRRAVDLPNNVRDRFIQAGMAHVLAASGFHVSLLLATILALGSRFRKEWQVAIAALALLGYLGLVGIQPSILRAVLMGLAALTGLLWEQRVKSLNALLLIAVILLIWQPLWLVDLGFEFSFLATFGLITTVPPLQRRLDWLPPTIASFITVPVAAFIWTIPLQIYWFKSVPTYSIVINSITSWLVAFLSLGGMLSGFIAFFSISTGAKIASVFSVSLQLLIRVIDWFNQLPFHALTVGAVSGVLMIGCYVILCLIWLRPWWQQHWFWGALLIIVLLSVTGLWRQMTLVRTTVLATDPALAIVLQNRGKSAFIGATSSDIVSYVVIPFLQQQGIQTLDTAIYFSTSRRSASLAEMSSQLSAKQWIALGESNANQTTDILRDLDLESNSLSFSFAEQRWQLNTDFILQDNSDIVIWPGGKFSNIQVADLESAIAFQKPVWLDVQRQLESQGIEVLSIPEQGPLQWSPEKGWQAIDLEPSLW
ncbi:MAG: ComEC/Rec2 family competence protein [Cyanobacteria bacterium P01_H01_bin.15]